MVTLGQTFSVSLSFELFKQRLDSLELCVRRRIDHARREGEPPNVGLVVLLHGHGAGHAPLHAGRREGRQLTLSLAEQ